MFAVSGFNPFPNPEDWGYIALRRDRLRSCNKLQTKPGGEGGIRTLGAVSSTLPFQGSTIGHSVTSPWEEREQTVSQPEVNRKDQ